MDALRSAKNAMSSQWANATRRPGILAVVAVSTVLLLIILIWIVGRIIDSGHSQAAVTKGVISLSQPSAVDSKRIPNFTDGDDFGISLWIYIHDLPRRASNSPILSINSKPVFAIESGRSNVVVTLPKAEGADSVRADADYDHVSLRRWVHLMAVHSEGSVSLFKDGELYSVTRVPQQDIVVPSGSVTLGGPPADAFISNVVFMSYFPSTASVKSMYRSGPRTSNWLFRLLGFSNYGVRSPVYKISSEQ